MPREPFVEPYKTITEWDMGPAYRMVDTFVRRQSAGSLRLHRTAAVYRDIGSAIMLNGAWIIADMGTTKNWLARVLWVYEQDYSRDRIEHLVRSYKGMNGTEIVPPLTALAIEAEWLAKGATNDT